MSTRTSQTCIDEGIALYKGCLYREAESCFVEGVRRARDAAAPPNQLCENLINLSAAYMARAKYMDVQNVLREALSLVAKEEGRESRLLQARCLSVRAQLMMDGERFQEAEGDFSEAIRLLADDYPCYTGELWGSLARLYKVGLELDDQALGAVEKFCQAAAAAAQRSSGRVYFDDALSLMFFGQGWDEDTEGKQAFSEMTGRAMFMRAIIQRETPQEAAALADQALDLTRTWGAEPHKLQAQVNAYHGQLAFGRGDWDDASKYIREALRLAESVYGKNHPAICDYLGKAACFTLMTDGLQTCEALMTRALHLLATALGERHPIYARYQLMWSGLLSFVPNQGPELTKQQETLVLNSIDTLSDFYDSNHSILIRASLRLARVYLLSARNAEAERLFTKALELASSVKNHGVELSCECLEQMTELWPRLGRPAALRQCLEKMLSFCDDPSFKNTRRKVQTLIHVSDQFLSLGDTAEAERALIKASDLAQVLDTILAQQCFEKLANFYMLSGQPDKAQALLKTAENDLPLQQVLLQRARASWGLCSTGRLAEAESAGLEVLRLSEAQLPDCIQSFMMAMAVLIDVYVRQERMDDACRTVGILTSKKEALGVPAKSILPACLKLIAEGYAKKKDHRAGRLYEQSIAAAEEIQGLQPEALDECIAAYGDFLAQEGQLDGAERLYTRLLTLRGQTYGETSYKYAWALLAMAEIAVARDLNQALERNSRGLTIIEAFPQPHLPTLIAALQLRAKILNKLKRNDEVKDLIERIKALTKTLKPEALDAAEAAASQEPAH